VVRTLIEEKSINLPIEVFNAFFEVQLKGGKDVLSESEFAKVT
jgi:hypothetical protein